MITHRHISSVPSEKTKKIFITYHTTNTGTVVCNCYPSDSYPPIQAKSKSMMRERYYDALMKAFPESISLCNSEHEIYSWLEKKGYFVVVVTNS